MHMDRLFEMNLMNIAQMFRILDRLVLLHIPDEQQQKLFSECLYWR